MGRNIPCLACFALGVVFGYVVAKSRLSDRAAEPAHHSSGPKNAGSAVAPDASGPRKPMDEGTPGIHGIVRFPEDELPLGVNLYLVHGAGPGSPVFEPTQLAGPNLWVVPDRPEFRFQDLEAGEYRLVVPGNAVRDDLVRPITVSGDSQEVVIEIPPADRSRGIPVRVQGPDGKEIQGVVLDTILVRPSADPGSGAQSIPDRGGRKYVDSPTCSVITQGSARFRDGTTLLFSNDEGTKVLRGRLPGQIVVSAKSSDYGMLAAAVSTPDEHTGRIPDIELRYRTPGRLRVMAADPSLKLDFACVLRPAGIIELAASMIADPVTGRSLSPGQWQFPPMQPGDYFLDVRIPVAVPPSIGYLDLDPVPVALNSGEQEQVLSIPQMHPVELSVPRSRLDRGSLTLGFKQAHSSWTTCYDGPIPDGTLRLPGLPAGEYAFGIAGVKGKMLVRIPHEGVIRLELQEQYGSAVRLDFSVAGQILRSLGFEEGDLIVGAGGELFSWNSEVQGFIRGATAGSNAIIVQRGSVRVSMDVDFSGLTEEQVRSFLIPAD